jgi:hypothetical protein
MTKNHIGHMLICIGQWLTIHKSSERKTKRLMKISYLVNAVLWDVASCLSSGLDPQDLHGATSQKMAFFTVTAVKTSNLT